MNSYEEYLKKYASKRDISEAEAAQHITVREVKKYYADSIRDAVSRYDTKSDGNKSTKDS